MSSSGSPTNLPMKYRRKSMTASDDPPLWPSIHRESSPFFGSCATSSPARKQFRPFRDLSCETGIHSDDRGESSFYWRSRTRLNTKLYALNNYNDSSSSIRYNSVFNSDDELPLTSDFASSDFSEDVDIVTDVDLSADEDVDLEINAEDDSPRSTCFSISAERGRWRKSPMPFNVHAWDLVCKPSHLAHHPATLSEDVKLDIHAAAALLDLRCQPSCDFSKDLAKPLHKESSLQPFPAKREIVEQDLDWPSSPLPPSSPPLSPGSTSPIRSESCSFTPEVLHLNDESVMSGDAKLLDLASPEISGLDPHTAAPSPPPQDVASIPICKDKPSTMEPKQPLVDMENQPHPRQSTTLSIADTSSVPNSVFVSREGTPSLKKTAPILVGAQAGVEERKRKSKGKRRGAERNGSRETLSSKSGLPESKVDPTRKEDIGVDASTSSELPEPDKRRLRGKASEKRKKAVDESVNGGPVKKKSRSSVPSQAETSKSSLRADSGLKFRTKQKTSDADDTLGDDKDRKVMKRNALNGKSKEHKNVPPPPGSTSSDLLVHQECEAPSLHSTLPDFPELPGLLIESLATSRATSLPASGLFKLLMQSQPTLKEQRTHSEWVEIIEGVLEEGCKRCGVFDKVESSFKDESDGPLEAQWFYVPEKDEDQERAALIQSLMPRAGKRSETKKYKQYYWKPLEKISRWDPEDEM